MNRRDRRRLVGKLPLKKLQPEPQVRRIFQKIGRNDPCPCGSGLKFKQCSCFNHEHSYYDFKKTENNEKRKSGKSTEEAGDN